MVIHVHGAIMAQSGELKRMKNIDRDVVSIIGEKTVELVFYSSKKKDVVKQQPAFTLSDNVVKKIMVPVYPSLSKLTWILAYIYVIIRYRPSAVIWEMLISVGGAKLVKKLSPKTKVIFDIHGAVAEEADYQNAPKTRVAELENYEQNAVNVSDYIICQSDEMKRYLISKYHATPEKICVYRCGVDINHFQLNDKKRAEIRKQMGYSDNDIVFVYSGGLHPWQRVSESIDLFEKYHSSYENSKFLVLTGDGIELEELIKEKSIDNSDNHIRHICLPFSEVSNYLNACDIAFLLRHNHTMNAVASPTKLAEYLACGLPVISSAIATKWVTPEGMKYIIDEAKITKASVIKDFLANCARKEVSCYASKNLSLDVDRNSIESFFINKRKFKN